MDATVFTPAFSRAATAYQASSVETVVQDASPHQLIVLLFDGLLQSVNHASGALQRKDVAAFGLQIRRAVRILDEGLKGGLDMERGGEIATNLRALYDYCVRRLTQANLHNDGAALAEVASLIAPVAESWKQIGGTPPAPAPALVGSVPAEAVAPRFPQTVGMAPRRMASTGAAAYAQGV